MPSNPDPARLKDAMTHWMVIVDAAIAWRDEIRRYEAGPAANGPNAAYMTAMWRLAKAVDHYQATFTDAADGLGASSDRPVS